MLLVELIFSKSRRFLAHFSSDPSFRPRVGPRIEWGPGVYKHVDSVRANGARPAFGRGGGGRQGGRSTADFDLPTVARVQ